MINPYLFAMAKQAAKSASLVKRSDESAPEWEPWDKKPAPSASPAPKRPAMPMVNPEFLTSRPRPTDLPLPPDTPPSHRPPSNPGQLESVIHPKTPLPAAPIAPTPLAPVGPAPTPPSVSAHPPVPPNPTSPSYHPARRGGVTSVAPRTGLHGLKHSLGGLVSGIGSLSPGMKALLLGGTAATAATAGAGLYGANKLRHAVFDQPEVAAEGKQASALRSVYMKLAADEPDASFLLKDTSPVNRKRNRFGPSKPAAPLPVRPSPLHVGLGVAAGAAAAGYGAKKVVDHFSKKKDNIKKAAELSALERVYLKLWS